VTTTSHPHIGVLLRKLWYHLREKVVPGQPHAAPIGSQQRSEVVENRLDRVGEVGFLIGSKARRQLMGE